MGETVRKSDRPILFSAPMVQALLREAREPGTGKTQTRRILKPRPDFRTTHVSVCRDLWMGLGPSVTGGTSQWDAWTKLPFVVGDRLWVKEAHQFRGGRYNDGTEEEPDWSDDEWFRIWSVPKSEDWDPKFPSGWSPNWNTKIEEMHDEGPDVVGLLTRVFPPIRMPRWASRLTLLVTEIRVERLNDISEGDAVAEGIEDVTAEVAVRGSGFRFWRRYRDGGWNAYVDSPIASYASLWTELHGAGSWEANPWIVAVTFRPILANIDALPDAIPEVSHA